MEQGKAVIGFNDWAHLPDLVVERIFDYLSVSDRLKASSSCSHWRSVLFQRRFFPDFKFILSVNSEPQCTFFRTHILNIVKELTIVFDFTNIYHIQKVKRILYRVARTESVCGIRFRTNNAGLISSGDMCGGNLVNIEHIFVEPLKMFLSRTKVPCKVLDLGAIEPLTYYGNEFLNVLTRPQEIKEITLASVKYDPSHYPILTLDALKFSKFTALEVFSVDYDSLNEELLHALKILPLKKLMIVVHGLDRNHPGISENAWADFASHFTNIELYLTLIYAFEAVEVLQVRLFRRNMPLTHFRVLFCDFMNVDALDWLSLNNNATLRSVKWIDSSYKPNSKNVVNLFLRTGQDPFVMMAWRCKNLEEIVVHGYVMDPHNIVGISRLRGRKLKRLEVSMIDTTPPEPSIESFIDEINILLGQRWAPLDPNSMHPAIGYFPVMEDVRDDYIFDVLRDDINN